MSLPRRWLMESTLSERKTRLCGISSRDSRPRSPDSPSSRQLHTLLSSTTSVQVSMPVIGTHTRTLLLFWSSAPGIPRNLSAGTQHTSDMDVSKIKDNVAEDVPIHSCNRRVDRPTVCVGRRKLDCCWNGERLAWGLWYLPQWQELWSSSLSKRWYPVFLSYEWSSFEEPARLCSPQYTAWVLCPAHHGRDSITGQNWGKIFKY